MKKRFGYAGNMKKEERQRGGRSTKLDEKYRMGPAKLRKVGSMCMWVGGIIAKLSVGLSTVIQSSPPSDHSG